MTRKRKNRRGLTLLELVVVMVILVALAGILVPLLPSMLGKAHTSTGATNITELSKWIETYHSLNFKYPDGFDSLCGDSGLYKKLPGYASAGSDTAAGGQITYGALTKDQSSALVNAGITLLRGMNNDTANATFEPYKMENDIVLTTTSTPSVAWADETRIEQLFGGDTTTTGQKRYVIVGIGAKCTAVGRGGMMLEAPIHFDEEAGANPTQTYQRFGAVFDLNGEKAQFVGVVAIHSSHLDSAAAPLAEYFAGK